MIGEIRSRYESLAPVMDERVTRLWAVCLMFDRSLVDTGSSNDLLGAVSGDES